ncbi:MAG: nucleoside monophosphate kinase, partial [bacterium]|nr:nucleoside monophosphate kinase [bacterium]
MMEKAAVLFMGLPGAGKGTQAFRLTKHFPNFVHFDTGGEIYRRITDPLYEGDEMVQKQKEIYFAGVLNDPQWVSDLVAERIRTYSAQDQGLVFSGSPRTRYEAEAIAPVLFDSYGKGRVAVLVVNVSEETARQRSLG